MKKALLAHGTRKRAVARATLYPGKGRVTINGQSLQNYGSSMSRLRIIEPLVLAPEIASTVDIVIKVRGGGTTGHSDAARLAIARALVAYNPQLKKSFEEYDRLLLVADVRQNEESKPNDSKPRDKRQKSYR